MYLFLDTETTGKYEFRLPPDHPSQPRIAQLAAIATDSTGKKIGEINQLIRPDGWTIPAEASAVHGFTTERCQAEGIPLQLAFTGLRQIADACTTIVAHNLDFDWGMLVRESLAYATPNPCAHMAKFCTMKAATPILKIPGRYGNYKWPGLAETHRHFFGCDFESAHDAMADVIACMKCFFKLGGAAVAPSAA